MPTPEGSRARGKRHSSTFNTVTNTLLFNEELLEAYHVSSTVLRSGEKKKKKGGKE